MPQLKGHSPKDDFFERGRKRLKDAENSKNPVVAKLRAKVAKRYFAQDTLGAAKVRPGVAFLLGATYLVGSTAIAVYCATLYEKGTFVLVLTTLLLFALLLLIFLFTLTGVDGSNHCEGNYWHVGQSIRETQDLSGVRLLSERK